MVPNTIYCGDACDCVESWPAGCVDLVFADPPYNIGYVYDKYRDDLPDADYVRWTKRWMAGCARVLKPNGSMYIAIGAEYAADVRVLGRELGLHLRNWIIWHYSFGQNMRSKFARSHTHIFYFTRDAAAFTFNSLALRYPSARHTEYQDLRANPDGRVPHDVWDEFPRVCGTFKERDGFHGCQLPEALLMRIILASSNVGEVVLDPFVGSGTTAAVAKRLGRQYVGIDLSEEYARRTRERLERVADESRLPADPDAWPALHVDTLVQIYRETKVFLRNLLPNEAALRVFVRSLEARTGAKYTVAQVREKLRALGTTPNALPRLPNEQPFVARNHVTTEGKRYVRAVTRYVGRREGEAEAKPGRPKRRVL
ncbi:MAG: site-specific DNA-methyltransferase [Phycisphaerae bacterium]